MESTRRKLMKEQGKYLIKIILVLLVFHTFNASFFFLKKKKIEMVLVVYLLVKFIYFLVSNLIGK